MLVSDKQHELDVIKWNKSQEMGKDACGTFDYCVKCDKSLSNPCENAFVKFGEKSATTTSKTDEKTSTLKMPKIRVKK